MTFELTARCSASELLVHCGGSGRGRTYTPFGLDLQSSEPAKCSTLPYFYKDNTFFLIYQIFCDPGEARTHDPSIKSGVL